MQTPDRAIETYIRAKDGNRPDLLRQAFAPQATLEMVVNTSAISFPSRVEGAAAIAQVLVSRFNQQYENIYTFCLGEPPAKGVAAHTCKWLVGMSVKDTAEVRVGCGQYHWQFDPASGLVMHLTIGIEHMQVNTVNDLLPVMDWLQGLDYPWCQAEDVIARAPQPGNIAPVIEYLKSL
ncbi:hypothetical protein PS3A_53830 [Pseudomonas sp. 3A(2025)]